MSPEVINRLKDSAIATRVKDADVIERLKRGARAFRSAPTLPTGPTDVAVEVEADTTTNILDLYANDAPSNQLAVDLFAGKWSSTLPAELGVTSGPAGLFEDGRITELIDWVGGVEGKSVLELGPLEGGHTSILDRAGANVYAIESNSHAFLRCLIVKNLLKLNRSTFALGDFVAYLNETQDRYDIALASGVLYHMVDPVGMLTNLARTSDHIALWTHYFDARLVSEAEMNRQFMAEPEAVSVLGATYQLHPREYLEALAWGGFCGGPETYARWMERNDIIDLLARLGFEDTTILLDHPDHRHGPAFYVLARRTGSTNLD